MTYAISTENFKIKLERNDTNDRCSVLATNHNDQPVSLKSYQNPMSAIESAIKAVVLDLINQMLHNGDIDEDQCELLAIEYGIDKYELQKLITEASGVSQTA